MIDPLLPKVYAVDRPLHDDWSWPLSLIPRAWTGRSYPMPPVQLAGTAPALLQKPRQIGYPIAAGYFWNATDVKPSTVCCPDPVPPIGCWTLQGVWCSWFGGFWLPCYFAFSVMVFGRRLHFNGPLKPDLTLGDWYWWWEGSCTWTKPQA